MTPNPLPLRIDRGAVVDRAMTAFVRACIVTAHAKLNPTVRPRDLLQRWGDESAARVEMVLRAATNPAMTSVTGWAKELAQVSIALLSNLIPTSAGAELLGRAIGLNFNGAASVNIPTLAIALADFVKQGDPIPVVQGSVTMQNTLTPNKFAVITALTREMVESSNAEVLVKTALLESTGPALDRRLFDSNPAVPDLRPAGILNGIQPLTTASGANPMVSDLAALAGSVAAKAGNGGYIFVAAPKQAVAIALSVFHDPTEVLISTTLPDKTIICVANNGIVAAFDDPAIDTTNAASWQADTAPVPIGSTPIVHTAFQKDILGLRLRWPISWAVRDPAAIAFVQNTAWPS